MKYSFTIFLSCILCFFGATQQKKVWGIILDSATKTPIENASITNMNMGKTSISNTNGRFNIDINLGDILATNAVNYFLDTFTIANNFFAKDTLFIYLKPIAKNLKNVTVTAYINRYSFDSTARRKNFLKDVGGNKITTVSTANSGAGIGINLDRFSKREKQKRRAYAMFDAMEEEAYINYRFSTILVLQYSTLNNEQLQQFMQQYRPTYTWLRKHTTEEDMKYYINEKLKQFFKRKN